MDLERPSPEVVENIEEDFGGPCRGRTYGPLIQNAACGGVLKSLND